MMAFMSEELWMMDRFNARSGSFECHAYLYRYAKAVYSGLLRLLCAAEVILLKKALSNMLRTY
jgi:hypothetical protein